MPKPDEQTPPGAPDPKGKEDALVELTKAVTALTDRVTKLEAPAGDPPAPKTDAEQAIAQAEGVFRGSLAGVLSKEKLDSMGLASLATAFEIYESVKPKIDGGEGFKDPIKNDEPIGKIGKVAK